MIYPFLVAKKAQVDLALWYQTMLMRNPRGKKIPADLALERLRTFEQMKSLNQAVNYLEYESP